MNSEVQVLEQEQAITQEKENLWTRFKDNGELVAAIVCGVFILFGWFLAYNGQTTSSALIYLLSFIIGGFAKAKEGIIDTIENKQLNVEILMILAAIGSAIIGYWTEGAILDLYFCIKWCLETYTMNKSTRKYLR